MYHFLGAWYVTMTHTCHNRHADSEEPVQPQHHGLSDAGRDMVAERVPLGMMVD